MFKNKTLLITGGTGSFGSTMLRRLADSDLKQIRVFSRDEKKQEDLRIELRNDKIDFIIGDVREFRSIDAAMDGVDFVFHTAALKQVPSCEFHPMQAIQTNVLGAENVLEAAMRNRVQRLVVLSTDKAVYPINTMGMSKALMEKLCINRSRMPRVLEHGGVFCCTRYGNVMCSRGSIIPLFIDQIRSGRPLTITDPEMTRFMMSLDDSVRLVLYAFENARPGDIFVQKAPAATVGTLALALKELFGADNEIRVIGARHGEKMHESLCGREEMARAEDLGDFYRIAPDRRDLNYTRHTPADAPSLPETGYNSDNTRRLDVGELKELLLSLPHIRHELRR
jgi:UDP-glucose 4-epimerase